MRRRLGLAAATALLMTLLADRLGADEGGRPRGPQSWDLATLGRAPAVRWLDERSPIRSLIYRGQPYRGRDTDVFAFYATPASVHAADAAQRRWPAVVLVHGGGGTAFPEWVRLWARRGYAAIAMDLAGRRPPAPRFDPATGELIPASHRSERVERLDRGGPDQGHAEKFESIGGGIDDDWPYHAVANVILAHSLLRSFSEVDPDRIAVTGISWGGYTTCIAASVDPRFKAAVPVYGCGFLHEGESVQKPQIDGLSPDRRREWVRRYDPSSHLGACRVPIFFVNGTNDPHYPLSSYARSYELVKGPRQIRIEVNMSHSHPAGWKPQEIGLFIDHWLKGTPALPQLGRPTRAGERASVDCRCLVPLRGAHLRYTADGGPLVDRHWTTRDAKVVARGGDRYTIEARPLPQDATIWLLDAVNERGAMVSTEVVFAR
jgi:dienelactone hydrolase